MPEDEALELRMEGGRVSHSWWMCVISHCYGVLGVYMDGIGGWYAYGIEPGWLFACREIPEHFLSAW